MHLRATDVDRVTIRQAMPESNALNLQSCASPEELRLEDGVQRVTMSGCSPEGLPQLETFRLAASSRRDVQTQVEALPLKRLTRETLLFCPSSQVKPFDFLLVLQNSGQELRFAPASVVATLSAKDCSDPLPIDGVFDDAGLGELVHSLQILAGKKS